MVEEVLWFRSKGKHIYLRLSKFYAASSQTNMKIIQTIIDFAFTCRDAIQDNNTYSSYSIYHLYVTHVLFSTYENVEIQNE